MKNCLLYVSCMQRGGTERMVSVYTKRLLEKGCQAAVLTNFRVGDEYELPEDAPRLNLQERIRVSGNRALNYIRRLREIRGICKSRGAEVAVAFGKSNALRLLLACAGLKTKVIIAVRTDPAAEYGGRAEAWLMKKLFALADGFIFQTRMQRDFFGRRIAKKSAIVPNSIEESFLQERYTGERENKIVSVGRLHAIKNHKLLLRSFARIAARTPETELVIWGEGSFRRELEQEIVRLGLQGRASLPGTVDDVAEQIKKAAVFVLSSDREGMPNALLEAMALGVPSISTDCPCGGPAEIIQDGKNGYLVRVGDEERLAERMIKLLSDKELQESFSTAAVGVRRRFSEKNTFDRFYEYLEAAAAK